MHFDRCELQSTTQLQIHTMWTKRFSSEFSKNKKASLAGWLALLIGVESNFIQIISEHVSFNSFYNGTKTQRGWIKPLQILNLQQLPIKILYRRQSL